VDWDDWIQKQTFMMDLQIPEQQKFPAHLATVQPVTSLFEINNLYRS
jgi:hypothetical protein